MTREEALKILKAGNNRKCTISEYFEAYNMAIQALEQEPKTGHWMKSNIGGAKVCSVCNAHMGLSSFKFCPNCGAKMVEPHESEDKK